MNISHDKVIYCKANTMDALDEICTDEITLGYLPLNGSSFGEDPETIQNIFYQTMVKEVISDEDFFIDSIKNITAKTSTELEKLVNVHLTNNKARCMGSAYIANGRWVQTVSNLKSRTSKNTISNI